MLAETGGVAMARAAQELVDILRALSDHYTAMDRRSRDGTLRPRVVDGGMGMAA